MPNIVTKSRVDFIRILKRFSSTILLVVHGPYFDEREKISVIVSGRLVTKYEIDNL